MLDLEVILTPPSDADTLVEPSPARMVETVRLNARRLAGADVPLLDTTVGSYRKVVRDTLVGAEPGPLIVTGHQPDFVHAGVWAKHVVTMRLAEALGGVGMNVVVDSDAPKRTVLRVPVVDGDRVTPRDVPYADVPAGTTFQQIPLMPARRIDAFARALSDALGARFGRSLMPVFLEHLRAAPDPPNWVAQVVHARRRTEQALGVRVEDIGVCRLPFAPVFADWMIRACHLADCYNAALDQYRRDERVRGRDRPIPNLIREAARCELPLWACHADQPRQRVFVERERGDAALTLWAGRTRIARLVVSDVDTCVGAIAALETLGGYRLRPRALALTLWMRMFLADLFIHGIGGAKYDRITDDLIRRYYGIEPPAYACVSATLRLDLPRSPTDQADERGARAAMRDVRFNPQRHVTPGPDLDALLAKRGEAISTARAMKRSHCRDRVARRAIFNRIRRLNAEILESRPAARADARRALESARRAARSNAAALSREYFFALHDGASLKRLLDALPAVRAFRV